MAISEEKMRMVIKNYFKTECDINTTIKEAFEKGFRIGVQKGISAQPDLILCRECEKKEVCRFYDTQGDFGYCRYGKKDGKANPQYFNTDK